MSTIKVDEIFGDQPTDAVDLPNKLKIGGASVEQGYTASGSEPSSPSNGDYWWDTGNDKLYRYMDGGFKELGLAAGGAWFGDRGITAGGKTSNSSGGKINTIEYKDITSSGNATDFGDLSSQKDGTGSVSDASRIVYGGGNNNAGDNLNTMEYITISTTGNVTDFGDLTSEGHGLRYRVGGFSDASRGVFASWSYGSDMEYISIQTLGNGTNFGELSATFGNGGMNTGSDGTYGIMGGGFGSSGINIIHRVTIQTAGDSVDFGDLTVGRGGFGHNTAISNAARVCFAGGTSGSSTTSNVIDYVVAANAGNATDLGDLGVAMRNASGTNNSTLGILCGGSSDNGTTFRNDIQKFTIETAGNASDYGDLTAAKQTSNSASGAAS
tara:strand:+ start:5960 stop:7105 length:1146 start_codon:yes stop_codon:yes gene_type:complete